VGEPRPLGHGARRSAARLPGLHQRADAEAQRRPGPRLDAIGVDLRRAGQQGEPGRKPAEAPLGWEPGGQFSTK
jgi:hypothetical protein